MQIAANSMTNKATAGYPRYNLRSGAVSEVDVVPSSESKENNRGVHLSSEPAVIMIIA